MSVKEPRDALLSSSGSLLNLIHYCRFLHFVTFKIKSVAVLVEKSNRNYQVTPALLSLSVFNADRGSVLFDKDYRAYLFDNFC